MSVPRDHGSRRALLRLALGVAVLMPTGARAQARRKMTRAEALYQDTPQDIRMCATCTLFEPPSACKVVEGAVSPTGWCKAFELAD